MFQRNNANNNIKQYIQITGFNQMGLFVITDVIKNMFGEYCQDVVSVRITKKTISPVYVQFKSESTLKAFRHFKQKKRNISNKYKHLSASIYNCSKLQPNQISHQISSFALIGAIVSVIIAIVLANIAWFACPIAVAIIKKDLGLLKQKSIKSGTCDAYFYDGLKFGIAGTLIFMFILVLIVGIFVYLYLKRKYDTNNEEISQTSIEEDSHSIEFPFGHDPDSSEQLTD